VSRSGGGRVASAYRWRVASGFCAIVTITVIAGYYVPTYREAARLRIERETLRAERVASDEARRQLQADLARARTENAELRREVDSSKTDRTGVARRIEKLEQLLSAQFGRLVKGKMLVVSSAVDRVSVALAVPALFSTRDRLTKSGRALLCELAKTIMAEYQGQVRVTGYYGQPRVDDSELGARSLTPWHLSAARAASAADALEKDCGAPADRFFVVGYGPRPAGPLGENVALEFIFRPED
jgi:chemotaxis protein MotB